MGFYTVNQTVNINAVEIEANSQEEADSIVLEDVKTRFKSFITVTEHTCN